jgi:hypothetical protein
LLRAGEQLEILVVAVVVRLGAAVRHSEYSRSQAERGNRSRRRAA